MTTDAEKGLIKQARADAAVLAATVGIDLGDAPADILMLRTSNSHSRIVLRLRRHSANDLVYKQIFSPVDGVSFQKTIDAHARAAQRVNGHTGLSVPEIYAADAATQSMLMQRVTGKTLNDHMLQSYENHTKRENLLAHAGAWLAAYHQPDAVTPSAFHPDFMMDHLHAQVQKLRAGDMAVAQPDRFIAAYRALKDRLGYFQGGQTHSTAAHGDMHTRNLLISPESVSGIDFEHTHNAPIGHDLARFLVDYATRFAQDQPLEKGFIIPADDIAAFFAGYGHSHRQDASFKFLLRQQILLEWLTIPATAADRSWFQSHRLDGVCRLAAHVFGV